MNRDVRVQLEVNTGTGTMCPVSDDHFVDFGMMHACEVLGLPIDTLNKLPAMDAAGLITHRLVLIDQYPAVPKTETFLENLLDDCLANPAAIVSVIEVEASKH